jgi:hypothetical protein
MAGSLLLGDDLGVVVVGVVVVVVAVVDVVGP